jgi:hypothetical protein
MSRPTALPLALSLALAAGCSRDGDTEGRRRIFSRDPGDAPASPAAHEAERPEDAVALGADEVAARLGSFDWAGSVDWTVTRRGDDAARVGTTERHRLRQLATGELEVSAQVDPGRGPGGVSGKYVILAGGMTYARGESAPWRERPTDRGRDARRFRDESFGLAAEVLRLAGEGLLITPAGDGALLGRRATRHTLSLDPDRFQPPPPARPTSATAPDDDTARRLAFLDGHEPRALSGELLLDAETGVALRVKLAATFAVRDQPGVKVEVQLSSQLRAVGGAVGEVKAPKDPLPDSRKPPGVAAALEAAGLKTRAQEAEKKAEPEDEEP